MANKNQNRQERQGRQNRNENPGNVEFAEDFNAVPQENKNQNDSRKNNKRNP